MVASNVLIKLKEELFEHDGHLIEGIFRMEPENNDECKQIENNLNNNNTFCSLDFGEIDG